jgi:hypothetical protein
MKFLLLLFATAFPLYSATTIEVSAKLADVPSGVEIPASAAKLEKMKGVNVLSAPKIATKSGTRGTVEITQPQSTPGGGSVPLGVTLEITPSLGEKNINFTGRVIDRAIGGKRTDDSVSSLEFATREVYFSGAASSGETVLIKTSAAVSKTSGKVSEIKTRELVVLLTFTKKTTTSETPQKVPAKVATPKSSTTKKSSSTKTSTTKKK